MTLIDYYVKNYHLFYKGLLKRSRNKLTTEEVMQQGFLHLNRTCKKNLLVNYSNPDNYIFIMLYNALNTHIKLNKKYLYEPLEDDASVKITAWASNDYMETAEDKIALEDRFETIVELIEVLPPVQKAIALDICKGISMQEIATQHKANYFTVKANWRYIARRLKKELNKKGEEFLWKVNI